MKDPDTKELFTKMFICVRYVDPYIHMQDVLIAAYLYCKDNYNGEHSAYYKMMCQIDFDYKGTDEQLADDFPHAMYALELLERNFKPNTI